MSIDFILDYVYNIRFMFEYSTKLDIVLLCARQKLFAEFNDPLAGPVDKAEYFTKAKALYEKEGEAAYLLEFEPGVLRRTAVVAPKRDIAESPRPIKTHQIWAPSPRMKRHEPSKWLVEPRLQMEYLGSMDTEDDEGASSAPETPVQTPVMMSPPHQDPPEHADREEDNLNLSGGDSEFSEEEAPKKKRAREEDSEISTPMEHQEEQKKKLKKES